MAFKAAGDRRREREARLVEPMVVAPRPEGSKMTAEISGARLSLRMPDLFSDGEVAARRLIDQAFALDQVRSVVVRRARYSITIELAPLADPSRVWRRLGALLKKAAAGGLGRAARLNLVGPAPNIPVRIARAGNALTTFRARVLSQEHLRIGHPLLRLREVRLRFEDLLRSVHGVAEVRSLSFSSGVVVVYDPRLIEAEQILQFLESAWPEVAAGPAVAPRPRKLVLAAGLLALSFAAQFFRPALLPWATAAVALYSLPNLIAAIRDLARGRVGLPALYTAGLGILLWTRLPFASSVMATFSQLWPSLANRLASMSESRLFAGPRRRIAWARVLDDARGEVIVGTEDLAPGDKFLLRVGEYAAADGVVLDGEAAVDEDMLTGQKGAAHKIAGDFLYAGSRVRDGALTVKVSRVGSATSRAALSGALPYGALKGLPSSAEVERIANRNAKPALLAAAALLLATRAPRLSQVVIRPDYATAPRLSAHLSALTAIAQSLADGVLVRRPAALDRISSIEVFAFDEGAILASRAVEVHKINVFARAAATETLALAAAALQGRDDPRALSLQEELETHGAVAATAHDLRQRAGQIDYWNDAGALISVASPARVIAANYAIPTPTLSSVVRKLAGHPVADPSQRPLVVARDRKVVGVIQFGRSGTPRLADFITTLRAENPEARFIHLSSSRQETAEAAVEGFGFDAVFAGLSASEKARALQSFAVPTAWIGDGADADAEAARAASAISISLAGLATLPADQADIVLLREDLCGVLNLRRIAAAHVGRIQGDYRKIYLANLLAVAGGFGAGFGSLQAGLVSNLGSAAVFLGRWRALANLARSGKPAGASEARRRLFGRT
jgi:cation transport ATPase